MKKLLISLVVMRFVCVGAAQAVPVVVENYSFELPDPGEHLIGWDGENGDDVPGWNSDSECRSSGIARPDNFPGTVGTYSGEFGCDGYPDSTMPEPGAWNLTGHTIAAGEIFTLTVDASDSWTNTGLNPKLKMTLYYDDGGRIEGNSVVHVMPNAGFPSWDEYVLVFDVDNDAPLSVGKNIGIELENVEVEPSGYSWLVLDNVRLDVVPEPATMTLLSLGSLALLKRRRA
jgi:PEP-CTERM motif